ncbi:MAG: hypothetical protein ACYDBZ_07670 [Steroidobacteraceae bacterium]
MPRTFRGEESRFPEAGAIEQYQARSMIEEYRGLAIVFAVLFLALAVYFVKSVLAAPTPKPPTQSVYVEMVPRDAPPQRQR